MEKINSTDRLTVDVVTAAEMIGCKRSFLYKMINSGDIKVIKLGRRTVISVDHLKEFIAQKMREAA